MDSLQCADMPVTNYTFMHSLNVQELQKSIQTTIITKDHLRTMENHIRFG